MARHPAGSLALSLYTLNGRKTFAMNNFVIAFLVASLFAARGLEAQSVEKKSWEIHVKFGSQTYLNELDPDPGNAPLGGFTLDTIYPTDP